MVLPMAAKSDRVARKREKRRRGHPRSDMLGEATDDG